MKPPDGLAVGQVARILVSTRSAGLSVRRDDGRHVDGHRWDGHARHRDISFSMDVSPVQADRGFRVK